MSKKYTIGLLALLLCSGLYANTANAQFVAPQPFYLDSSTWKLFNTGQSLQLSDLTITGTCTGCPGVTSTNPLMADYFVGTSTTATSTLAGNLKVDGNLEVSGVSLFDIVSSGNLTVSGDLNVTGNASTTQMTTTGQTYLATNGGNVGVGTTSPSKLFSVHGDSLFSGDLGLANLTATGTLNITGLSTLGNASTTQITSTGSTYLSISSGNVGIGTTTPAALLDVAGQAYTEENDLTDGATIAIDWDNGNQQRVVLGDNRTITLANPERGGAYRLILCQDGTGSRTVTWPDGIAWPAQTAPTLTTTADHCDIVSFLYTYGTSTPRYFGASNADF